MDANEYQHKSARTASPEMPLINAAMGMCGESGEFIDVLKKHLFQGHDLDRDHLAKELGDVLFYVALACTALDLHMGDVMEANIAKLTRRYPDGFSAERSRNREA